MPSHKSKTSLIISAYQFTIHSLKSQRKLFVPFIIFAIIESVVLMFIFVIPRAPFVKVFGAPIRAFWGEAYLHYPANFLLLPKLAYISRTILSVILGSLLTGMAVAMVFDVYTKKALKLKDVFKSALRKYVSLFAIVLILTIIFYSLVKLFTINLTRYFMAGHNSLLFLKPGIWLDLILICINILIGIFIQAIFAYAIPVLIVENESLIKATIKSFVLFKKLFAPTLVLIGLPILVYIPIIILNHNNAFLIQNFSPELVLAVSFLSIIVNSLIIDLLITVSTTFLYLENRRNL